MVNYNRHVDQDGFITQSRRRIGQRECNSVKTYEDNGRMRSDVKVNDRKNIKVERKIIGASMGKKGIRDIIHVAICFKAGIWLARILKLEANGGDGKSLKWNFREDEDWMLAVREENEFGEFIRLHVYHNKAYPETLFLPAGNNGVGWWDTGFFWDELMTSVSKIKERRVIRDEFPVKPVANAWFEPKRKDWSQHKKDQFQTSLIKPKSDQGLDSLWIRTLVVEVTSATRNFEWKDVGRWVMEKFGWSFGFDLQPIDGVRDVFVVTTFAELSRVKKIGNWKRGTVDIRIFSWFAGINEISKPEPESIKNKWVGVKGIPYNRWDFSTFKIIGDKFGGLIVVSPESSMATYLSEIRVLVLGPVSNGVWCEESTIGNKEVWAEIRVIGEILETSREDLKPVSIIADRIEPPLDFAGIGKYSR
ncbi:hypothetical protein MKX03_001761 [Papaver bracteatum]|nr:hypothetical protein MKX03_001761 [Papaver bracteatum]